MYRHGLFTTKQVCSYFFTPVLDSQDEETGRFRCRCGTVRKQEQRTGYSNLIGHVRGEHQEYVATMEAAGAGSETLVGFIDRRSQRIHDWIDFVISCNMPFSTTENDAALKYLKMDGISTETLDRYMTGLYRQVESSVANILPAKFGIVFDGWTFQSEHYVAVFATFPHDGVMDTVLLSMSPLVDDEVVDHSAQSHVDFLVTVLAYFNKTTDAIAYLVGDNCAVNGLLAELLNVPIVGCASHRLNFAVMASMADEAVLDKIHQIMRKLRGLNAAAKLRRLTHFDLSSVKRRGGHPPSTWCLTT